MKLKFLFSLFALTGVLTSRAQINKGSLLLGGSIGFNQIKSKGDMSLTSTSKTTTTTISPSIGVAIKENLVFGARFNYMKYKQRNNYDAMTTSYLNTDIKNYGGGIFLRGYVPLINRLYVFGEGYASYIIDRETSIQGYYNSKNERKIKAWSTGLSFTPGISYGVTKKFQIEGGFNSLFSAAYGKSKSTYNGTPAGTSEAFKAGISQDNESMFFVGFRFVI